MAVPKKLFVRETEVVYDGGMTENTALELILQSPQLPHYAALIQQRMDDERRQRERFYQEMTDESKMEFVAGEVIMHSPARHRNLNVSRHLIMLLGSWVARRELGIVHVEKALCVFTRNDYEPDIVFFGREKSASIREDTLKFPVPDFIVEILSESTVERDRGVKFDDYQRHQVSEYWIVDPDSETLEQYLPDAEGKYELKLKSGSGEVTSKLLGNLQIPVRAVFDPVVLQETMAGWN